MPHYDRQLERNLVPMQHLGAAATASQRRVKYSSAAECPGFQYDPVFGFQGLCGICKFPKTKHPGDVSFRNKLARKKPRQQRMSVARRISMAARKNKAFAFSDDDLDDTPRFALPTAVVEEDEDEDLENDDYEPAAPARDRSPKRSSRLSRRTSSRSSRRLSRRNSSREERAAPVAPVSPRDRGLTEDGGEDDTVFDRVKVQFSNMLPSIQGLMASRETADADSDTDGEHRDSVDGDALTEDEDDVVSPLPSPPARQRISNPTRMSRRESCIRGSLLREPVANAPRRASRVRFLDETPAEIIQEVAAEEDANTDDEDEALRAAAMQPVSGKRESARQSMRRSTRESLRRSTRESVRRSTRESMSRTSKRMSSFREVDVDSDDEEADEAPERQNEGARMSRSSRRSSRRESSRSSRSPRSSSKRLSAATSLVAAVSMGRDEEEKDKSSEEEEEEEEEEDGVNPMFKNSRRSASSRTSRRSTTSRSSRRSARDQDRNESPDEEQDEDEDDEAFTYGAAAAARESSNRSSSRRSTSSRTSKRSSSRKSSRRSTSTRAEDEDEIKRLSTVHEGEEEDEDDRRSSSGRSSRSSRRKSARAQELDEEDDDVEVYGASSARRSARSTRSSRSRARDEEDDNDEDANTDDEDEAQEAAPQPVAASNVTSTTRSSTSSGRSSFVSSVSARLSRRSSSSKARPASRQVEEEEAERSEEDAASEEEADERASGQDPEEKDVDRFEFEDREPTEDFEDYFAWIGKPCRALYHGNEEFYPATIKDYEGDKLFTVRFNKGTIQEETDLHDIQLVDRDSPLLAPIEARNDEIGFSSLADALKAKDSTAVLALLQRGAQPDSANSNEEAPLTIASKLGDIASAKILLQFGAMDMDGSAIAAASTEECRNFIITYGFGKANPRAQVQAMDAGSGKHAYLVPKRRSTGNFNRNSNNSARKNLFGRRGSSWPRSGRSTHAGSDASSSSTSSALKKMLCMAGGE